MSALDPFHPAIREWFSARLDRGECARLIAVPQMSRAWKRWAEDTLRRTGDAAKAVADPGCCEGPSP